jgi:hypothetical protein
MNNKPETSELNESDAIVELTLDELAFVGGGGTKDHSV